MKHEFQDEMGEDSDAHDSSRWDFGWKTRLIWAYFVRRSTYRPAEVAELENCKTTEINEYNNNY